MALSLRRFIGLGALAAAGALSGLDIAEPIIDYFDRARAGRQINNAWRRHGDNSLSYTMVVMQQKPNVDCLESMVLGVPFYDISKKHTLRTRTGGSIDIYVHQCFNLSNSRLLAGASSVWVDARRSMLKNRADIEDCNYPSVDWQGTVQRPASELYQMLQSSGKLGAILHNSCDSIPSNAVAYGAMLERLSQAAEIESALRACPRYEAVIYSDRFFRKSDLLASVALDKPYGLCRENELSYFAQQPEEFKDALISQGYGDISKVGAADAIKMLLQAIHDKIDYDDKEECELCNGNIRYLGKPVDIFKAGDKVKGGCLLLGTTMAQSVNAARLLNPEMREQGVYALACQFQCYFQGQYLRKHMLTALINRSSQKMTMIDPTTVTFMNRYNGEINGGVCGNGAYTANRKEMNLPIPHDWEPRTYNDRSSILTPQQELRLLRSLIR